MRRLDFYLILTTDGLYAEPDGTRTFESGSVLLEYEPAAPTD